MALALRLLALPLALGIVAAPGRSATPEEIDAGAAAAASAVRQHVEKLASNRMAGRDNDSPGSRRAQRYLVKRLKSIGEPLGSGRKPFLQRFQRDGEDGANVLALIRGGELPEEYVVVGAHYDHFGPGRCGPEIGTNDRICNGATDNAAGSGVALAVAAALAALPEAPRRSVVVAFWDAEEDGLVGSSHYVQSDPRVPLAQTVAYVNLDLLGATLIPSLANNTFAIGSETGGPELRAIVEAAAAQQTVHVTPLSYVFGQQRGDYFPFGQAGIPLVWYGDSGSACYHTAGDDLARVNWDKLSEQTAVAFRTVVALAEADPAVSFVAPAQGPSYDDAASLQGLLELAVPVDLGLFTPQAQVEISDLAALIAQIVAEGPAAYDSADAVTVIATAAVLIRHLEALPCPAW